MRAATPIRTTAFVLVGLAASASLGIAGEQAKPARDRLAPTISPQGFDSQAVAAAIGPASPVRGLSRRSTNSSNVNPVPIRSSPYKPVPEPTDEHLARPASYFLWRTESTKAIWDFPGSSDAEYKRATDWACADVGLPVCPPLMSWPLPGGTMRRAAGQVRPDNYRVTRVNHG